MTNKEIINEIKHILEELNYEDAVSYLTQNDKTWLKESIKALEQEPCEDAISMMDLLNNLHKHFSKGFETDEWWNSTHVLQAVKDCRPELFDLNYVPSVQPKQIECEDAISRKDILNCQYTIDENETLGISTRNVVNVDDILNAKPVTPQPKTGHWISYWDEEARCQVYKCPKCGNKQPFDTKYCWECGTRLNVPDKNDGKMSEIPTGSESEAQE